MKFQWPLRRDPPVEAKALTFIPQSAAYEFPFGSRLPGSNVNYATEVHNGMQSSVVTSALCWMMRTFPEAPVVVQRSVVDRWETVLDHDLAALIRRPNPEYGGRILWMCTILDFCYGEAFWLKVRDGNRKVVELWWIPRQMITPFPDVATGMLDHYIYQPPLTAASRVLRPDDIVHFRFGKDPRNLLRGFSPLASVMREVYVDDQAANFTAAILKNLGVIGVKFSPKEGIIPEEQAKKIKAYVESNFTGDNRGKALFFTGAMDAQVMQYNLQAFDVGPIRDVSEERVCAALAIPAAVIGFGTGLQQTKVGATMREMIKLAWQGGIEPNQAIMADELDRSLLPEFQTNARLFRTHFDTSQVEALTETPAEKTDRVIKLTEGNIITISEAQRELGLPVDSKVDKYLRELVTTPTKPTVPLPRNRLASDAAAAANNAPAPGEGNAPAATGSGNGTQP